MILTVASGKGGTGKTTFAVNLAHVLAKQGQEVRLLDCDVEAPNAHLFVRPVFTEEKDVTALKPVWEETRCTGCGACAEACHFNAMAVIKGKVLIFNELCHACGVCTHVCPEDALAEREAVIGQVQATAGPEAGGTDDDRPAFFLAQGVLKIGETLAPRLVDAVKTHIAGNAVNLLDASPGTTCPVVHALEGADVAVLVTEPTPFGLHDLELAVAMALQMGIPTGIVVNRSDGEDTLIRDYAARTGVPIVGRIPFKRTYAETYSEGELLAKRHPELKTLLLNIYHEVCRLRGATIPPVPAVEERIVTGPKRDRFPMGTATDYRELAVISGKGGTGKTTVTAAFAELASLNGGGPGRTGPTILADHDVDAADLHLLLPPRIHEAHPFVGAQKASVDSEACMGCGRCDEACHFNALRLDGPGNDLIAKTWRIDPLACEGCGLCALVCPVDAIRLKDAVTGEWFVSGTDHGPLVHAQLGIAEENSGRLVTRVRRQASALADEYRAERILSDGPPGIGCPVIASVSGTDLVLVVTESTVAGVHDLARVLDLASHFGVETLVLINKADLNLEQAKRIEQTARQRRSRVIGRIPFDRAVNRALLSGKTIVQFGDTPAAAAVEAAWQEVSRVLAGPRPGTRESEWRGDHE